MLLVLALVLLSIGVIVIYAIGPALAAVTGTPDNHYINRQLVAIAISLIAFALAANVPLVLWQKHKLPLLIAAGVMTLIALLMPVNPDYPAHRWVRLGTLSFQSVELLKLALLIWVASLLGSHMQQGGTFVSKGLLKPLGAALAGILVIVAGVQSDLGSTVVMVAMIAAMAVVAGLPMRRILMVGAVIIIGGILLIAATPYRRDRLSTFFNPSADCQSTGYQACHAQIAVGSGGIIGQGLGSGAQAYGYLPKAENDSIFAIYAEKFGFLGVALMVGVFIGFFARMRRIAERAEDSFARLVVVGVIAWLSVQAMMNIGAMLGILPLKGITLPLVSYGGTSVVFIMTAIGLVFQISRYTQFRLSTYNETRNGGGHEDRLDRRRIRGAYHPTPGSRA
ncbi:MAG: FtsW/RodA/SpoVE family cell cycle protein [Candidatus Saccharimonadales bacterium]